MNRPTKQVINEYEKSCKPSSNQDYSNRLYMKKTRMKMRTPRYQRQCAIVIIGECLSRFSLPHIPFYLRVAMISWGDNNAVSCKWSYCSYIFHVIKISRVWRREQHSEIIFLFLKLSTYNFCTMLEQIVPLKDATAIRGALTVKRRTRFLMMLM